MAGQRTSEDSHEGSEPEPKLIVVGRLQGTVEGRPYAVEAEGQEIVLKLDGIRVLLPLLRVARALVQGTQWFDWDRVPRIKVCIGKFPAISVTPNSFAWKWFLKLRKL